MSLVSPVPSKPEEIKDKLGMFSRANSDNVIFYTFSQNWFNMLVLNVVV